MESSFYSLQGQLTHIQPRAELVSRCMYVPKGVLGACVSHSGTSLKNNYLVISI